MGVKRANAFVAILLLTITTGIYAATQWHWATTRTKDIASHWLPSTRLLSEIDSGPNGRRRAEIQYVRALERAGVEENDKCLQSAPRNPLRPPTCLSLAPLISRRNLRKQSDTKNG